MPIKESLQALMKQEGWTAEQVTKAIKKLQDVSLGNCSTLIPYISLGGLEQNIIFAFFCGRVVGLQQLQRSTWFAADYHYDPRAYGEKVYRINPDFVIPDLEETKPRYESGTWRVDPNDGEAVVVVDREEWYKAHEMTSAPHEAKPDWWALKTAQGIMWEDEEGCLPLPPRHDLKEGWEYTGKAAKIDGTQKLADDEVWLDIYGVIALSGYASKKHNNQWRHIARKKKEEPKPVEYVDYDVSVDKYGYLKYDKGIGLCGAIDAVAQARFIAYIYEDGVHSDLPRRLRPWEENKPALIPTHVRMAKEAE